jgi:hypothetical protein
MNIAIEKVMNLTEDGYTKILVKEFLDTLVAFSIYDEVCVRNMKMVKINDKIYTTGELSEVFERYIEYFNGKIRMSLNDFVTKYEKEKEEESRLFSFIEDIDDEYQENVYGRKQNINFDDIIAGEDDTINENPVENCPVCLENIKNKFINK